MKRIAIALSIILLVLSGIAACCSEDRNGDGILDCDPTPTVVYPTLAPELWK